MKAKIFSQYYADSGQFITKEESRYSLDSMRVEPHPQMGVIIVATDGHTMGVFHDRGGECPVDGITLRYDASLAGMCGQGHERTLEINDDGSASLLKRGVEVVRFNAIETDGKFPAWRLPLPRWNKDVKRTDYNPEYIARCAEVSRAKYPHLAVWSGTDVPHTKHAEEGPTVIVPYERDDCFFLVMPMRKTDDMHWPELLDALRPKDHADLPETKTEQTSAEALVETANA